MSGIRGWDQSGVAIVGTPLRNVPRNDRAAAFRRGEGTCDVTGHIARQAPLSRILEELIRVA